MLPRLFSGLRLPPPARPPSKSKPSLLPGMHRMPPLLTCTPPPPILTRTPQIIAQEGPKALFRGWEPRVIWIGIGGSVFFTVRARCARCACVLCPLRLRGVLGR